MAEVTLIEVRTDALDPGEVLGAVQHPSCGGAVLFVGMVRDRSEGQPVNGLTYEAYEGMAREEMMRIACEIVTEMPGVRLAAVHRVGQLQVGELAIVCAAGAPHRQQAFKACRLLIDRIKERVPVWKREHGAQGSAWVGWDATGTGEPPESKT
jgi:molybdopterin synthase catalytic subunit